MGSFILVVHVYFGLISANKRYEVDSKISPHSDLPPKVATTRVQARTEVVAATTIWERRTQQHRVSPIHYKAFLLTAAFCSAGRLHATYSPIFR